MNMHIYTRGWSVRECTVSSPSCNRGLIAKIPGTTDFINLQFIISYDLLVYYFLGLFVAFSTLRFIKVFRFNKRIIVFLVCF